MWTFVFLFLVVRAQSSPITYISSILSEFKQFFRTYEVDGAISVERIRSKLTERIMGQQNAIAVVSHLLEKHYRNSSNGPLLMLFGGPSGCGKTLMAETIAEALTTTDGKSIRMFLRNMAELSLIDDKQDSEIEMHMLQTDIFNHLKKRPNSILVFDEIQLMKQIHIERLVRVRMLIQPHPLADHFPKRLVALRRQKSRHSQRRGHLHDGFEHGDSRT